MIIAEVEIGQRVLDLETNRVGTVLGVIRALGLVRIALDSEGYSHETVLLAAEDIRRCLD